MRHASERQHTAATPTGTGVRAPAARAGLRERKKARTREAIQQHALRLFQEQGYEATTVEQIAEAAEVSQSTFFRYFRTKEDVVLYDPFDPIFIAAYRAAPAELGPIQAVRKVWRDTVTAGALDIAVQWQRAQVILGNDGLRARMLDEMARSQDLLAELVAERCGRDPGDMEVRATTGAMMGIVITAWLGSGGDLDNLLETFDAGLAFLEAGLPL